MAGSNNVYGDKVVILVHIIAHLFRIGLRQAVGFIKGYITQIGKSFKVISYTQASQRFKKLNLKIDDHRTDKNDLESIRNRQNIIYIDECVVDSGLYREYAYAPKGEKVVAKISGKRPERVRIIAGKRGKEIIAPMAFSGYTDSSIFELYIEKFLCPELRKNEVVIFDNASFHKSVKTKNLIENACCKLMFLPTYSPDLNPIEHFWSTLKSRIRKILPHAQNINLAIDRAFQQSRY